MPGPEAKTEYHCVAFFASVDLPKLLTVIFSSARLHELLAAEEAGPVGVHAEVQRLVVEQLRRPLDGVDLGDLRGDHQPRDLEQLVGGHVAVADDLVGPRGVAQPGVGVGRGGGLRAERVDEQVVLAREHVW